MPRNIFSTLPAHPKPQYLESITSYLLCLKEENGLSSLKALNELCFPQQALRLTSMADFPPLLVTDFMKVSGRTNSEILQLTFYHLGKKMGRSTSPQAMSQFLTDSLAPSLRYCPCCLGKSTKHHSLLWRFYDIGGCPEHGTELLNCCLYCGSPIPFISLNQTIGLCPTCKGDLSKLHAPLMQPDDAELNNIAVDNLEFLLVEHAWENDSEFIMPILGQYLTEIRWAEGVTQEELANYLNVSLNNVQVIENNKRFKGANFSHYMAYVSHFELKFRDIFSDILQNRHHYEQHYLRRRERDLAKRAKSILQELQESNEEVNADKVARSLGISRATLWRYKRIWNLVAQARKQYLRQWKDH